ncbi:unnamed protein product [Effrenium voratum]|nr:unnamed protein product [Effrenium voratum]
MPAPGKMIGVAYDGPVPPGPPLREGGAPNGGAASLQQKMSRQRQLALEKQRVSARKQLGAGVIASASPMLQASHFRGRDWDQMPDGLGLSSPVLKESRSSPEPKTAPTSPQEDRERPEAVKTGTKPIDDALDGLAEELLLDDRLPAGKKLEESMSQSRGGSSPSKVPGGAWSDGKDGVEAELGPREGLRRKQQTLILDEENPSAAPQVKSVVRVTTPPAAPGRSWDLTVEDSRTEPGNNRRSRAEPAKSWWPFGGGGASVAPAEIKEEVTAVSSFTFD